MLRRYFQIQRTPSKSCFTRPQSKNRDSIPVDTMTKLSQTVRNQGVGNGTLLALKSAKQNALQLFKELTYPNPSLHLINFFGREGNINLT